MENLKDSGKLVGALVLGAVVGAALGILFAPDKGSKTRQKLMGGAQDLAEDLKQKFKEEAEVFRTRAEELEILAEGKMESLGEKAKQKIDVFTNHS